MAQSGQFTLELPYAIIGLGTTPNFVEKITVAIPPNKDSVCHFSFLFIDISFIAEDRQSNFYRSNSQCSSRCHSKSDLQSGQVSFHTRSISQSKNHRFRWEMKLFVTPSRMILHTGIALGVTLIVIALILTIQQYRQKVDGRIFFSSSSQLFEYFIFRSKMIANEKNNPNDFITMLYNPQSFYGQIECFFHLLFFICFNDQTFFDEYFSNEAIITCLPLSL